MPPKRVSSKLKNRQLETKMLEDQAKKMEEKLSILRQQVEQKKKLQQANPQESTVNRWRKATGSNVPLRDYAKKVLNDRKEAYNKYGIDQKKILNKKTLESTVSKIKCQKLQAEQKNGTRLPFFEPAITTITGSKSKLMGDSGLPIQSIDSNFFKAKINTKQLIKRKTLEQFLEEHYLLQYLDILRANNFIQLDDLFHITRQQMTQMGIKSGHQVKIMKRIKEEINGTTKDNTQDNSKEQPTKKNIQNQQNIGQEKVSFGYGDGDVNQYEEIKRREEQNIQDNNHNQQLNQENQEEVESQQSQPEQYAEQEADTVLLTIPFSQQTMVAEGQQTQIKEQYNCFQCYRKRQNQPLLSSDGRKFCLQKCLDSYLRLMQKVCPECGQNFYKFEGYYQEGLWFCSLKCSPNQEEIESMFIDWRKQQSK